MPAATVTVSATSSTWMGKVGGTDLPRPVHSLVSTGEAILRAGRRGEEEGEAWMWGG